MISFVAPYVSAIITGVDYSGAHIYLVENATVTCQDFVGFAAIGAGYRHADSQLMFAGHTRGRPLPASLLLTYSAKRRSEVAPGVGEGTDMFIIGPDLGVSYQIGEHVVKKLDEIYRDGQKRITKAGQLAETKVKKYVEEDLAADTTAQVQTATPSEDIGGGASSDEEAANAADAADTVRD
jgi:hypothetical protein